MFVPAAEGSARTPLGPKETGSLLQTESRAAFFQIMTQCPHLHSVISGHSFSFLPPKFSSEIQLLIYSLLCHCSTFHLTFPEISYELQTICQDFLKLPFDSQLLCQSHLNFKLYYKESKSSYKSVLATSDRFEQEVIGSAKITWSDELDTAVGELVVMVKDESLVENTKTLEAMVESTSDVGILLLPLEEGVEDTVDVEFVLGVT